MGGNSCRSNLVERIFQTVERNAFTLRVTHTCSPDIGAALKTKVGDDVSPPSLTTAWTTVAIARRPSEEP
jgi:hypothetical protein